MKSETLILLRICLTRLKQKPKIMYNPYSLEGKTILVTGASSGIGRATAIECSKMGAKVVITARNEERLKETFDSLEGEGHQLICFDLSESDKLDEFVAQLPSLQGFVSNAGTNKMAPVNFIKEDDLNDVLKVNALSPILLLRLLLKKKKLEKSSSVVFTSSPERWEYYSRSDPR